VLHFLEDGAPGHADRPQVGFVVSKAVGSAVRRNLVQRRLRHLARERLSSFPGSAVLVVRALPAAAAADYRDLATDFDRALARVLRRREGDGARP
jgi:ribonuclease P protein component